MVLWEITLGTAYFLGLKRTYRLALRIQPRVISPKHPRIRQFVHRLMGQVSIGLLADESQIGNGHFEVYLLIKLESKEDYDDNDDGGGGVGGVDNDTYDTDMGILTIHCNAMFFVSRFDDIFRN
ncbi:hypothetical protein WN944_007024 [Citrus x changshan-huyou]|uniref:Uncharacterized protein n=1 Tax=Citrus x changshan-huyou TaxID=2935761 RepID=A0AAP0MK81_9ROSI